jgi:hypothetical protein
MQASMRVLWIWRPSRAAASSRGVSVCVGIWVRRFHRTQRRVGSRRQAVLSRAASVAPQSHHRRRWLGALARVAALDGLSRARHFLPAVSFHVTERFQAPFTSRRR